MGSNAGEDAATAPHVDTGVVIAIAKQDVGRAVPQRHHLAGVSIDEKRKKKRLLHRNARGACKTEIAQLQLAISVDEKVLRLEVPRSGEEEAESPVENAITMAFLQSTEDLIHEGLGVRLNEKWYFNDRHVECLFPIKELAQVLIQVLEHHR